jgi:hypothetical protein
MNRNSLRVERCLLLVACEALVLSACGGSGTHPTGGSGTTGSATSGAVETASGASASSGAAAGSGTASGSVAGTGAGSLAAAGTGSGTGGSTGSGTGANASSGNSGAQSGSGTAASGASSDGGPSDASLGDGPLSAAGCANNKYPLCIDFENGIDTTIWTGGTASAVTTADYAHGGHSYLLYPKGGAVLKVKNLGPITNQLWSRFYIHFSPGAPGGHGNILGAYDPSNNWYEIGWQFNGILGDYHLASGHERATRSKPTLVDQWYCIESFFDGTMMNMPVWWIDGQDAQYYMADPAPPIPQILTQFATITVGFTPYAGLGLNDEPYGNSNPPVLANMYIDDIAFDVRRIGCIAGPVGPDGGP